MVDGVPQEVTVGIEVYPPLDKAPMHVVEKALTFEVHDECVEPGALPCNKCRHLINMAYICFYGHHLSIGEVMKAIGRDLEMET